MKKKWLVIVMLLLSILITIGVVFHVRVSNIEETLNFYVTEDKEFFYFNENTLYGLKEDGQIFYEVEKEANIEWYELVVDDNRNSYLLAEEYYGKQNVGTSVSVYREDGSSERLYETKTGVLSNIGYQNGFVSAFVLEKNGSQVKLWKYDVKRKTSTESLYELQESQEIVEIIYTATGDIYYLTSEAELCKISSDNIYSEIILEDENGEVIVPYLDGGFSADLNGNIYFTDGYHFTFVKYDSRKNEIEKIYERESKVTSQYMFYEFRYMRYMGDILTAVSPSVFNSSFEKNDFYFIKDSFHNSITINEKSMTFSAICKMIVFAFFSSFLGICFIALLGYGIVYIVKNLRSLLLKQLLIIIPLTIIVVVIIVTSLKTKIFEVIEKDAYSQLYTLTTSIIKMIDVEEFEAVDFPRERQDNYYQKIDDMINLDMGELHELFPDILEKDLYYSLYAIKDGYSCLVLENEVNVLEAERTQIGLREEFYSPITNEWFLFEDPNNHTYVEHDGDEEWFYYARVFTNKENKIIGYLEVGFDKFAFEQEIEKIGNEVSLFVVILLIVMVCFIMFSLHQSLKNLRVLRKGVTAVSDGQWTTTVDIRSNDEMEDIGNAFNKMSYRVSKYLDSIVKLNTAYERFVPNKIFHLLGKETILDVKLGDKVIRKLSIMSVSMGRLDEMDRTHMGEKFELINQILGDIASIINQYSGIIETFQGSSIRAIYMQSVDEAIDTALHIIEKINHYQEKELINLSINVQYGDAILGVVGDEDRLDTTIVSDDVDFIYTLNKFSISNQTKLLVTKEVYEKIIDKPKYNFRYVGKLEQANINRVVDVYDLIDAYSFYDKTNKLLTRELFEKGVGLFIAGNFTEARKQFIDVIRIDSNDEVAKMYLFLCDEYKDKVGEYWKGILNQ